MSLLFPLVLLGIVFQTACSQYGPEIKTKVSKVQPAQTQAVEVKTSQSQSTDVKATQVKTTQTSSSQTTTDDDKTAKDKQLAERERRLRSLAKSVEKEDRPATPTFSNTKKKGNSITFDDIKFEMEKSERFQRSMLNESINDLVGKRLTLKGYIRPSIRQKGLSKFIFVRDDKECCFGPGAALYDCVLVTLSKGETSDFTVYPITVEGEFYLKEFKGPDGRIWAVYRMKNCEVK